MPLIDPIDLNPIFPVDAISGAAIAIGDDESTEAGIVADSGFIDSLTSDRVYKYHSYSGTDIAASMIVPGEGPIYLGEVQTISYSIHRENTPVRLLGHVNPTGFVKGPRTIAGSLIFTVFDEYAFYRVKKFSDAMHNGFYPLADMMPPFDVSISFSNEYGIFSKMRIFGISIIDEGGTMSVDDLITEQTYSYMARGLQPITSYNPAEIKRKTLLNRTKTGEPKYDGMTFN